MQSTTKPNAGRRPLSGFVGRFQRSTLIFERTSAGLSISGHSADFGQVTVDSADFSAEDAVHGHAEGSRLAIHSAAATHEQTPKTRYGSSRPPVNSE